MNIVCLDLEGVLVPEIWIAFSEKTGIPEFRRTTRDEPDYDKLMRYRLELLERHGLGLHEIEDAIAGIERRKRWTHRLALAALALGLLAGCLLMLRQPAAHDIELRATADSLQQVVAQLDSQVVAQRAEAAVKAEADEQRMAAMGQDLGAMTTANQALRQEQDRAAQRQRQVAATVERGKRAIDQAMRATHLMEYLDTLSPPNQVRRSHYDEMLAGGRALDQFMAGLQGYNGQEMSSIHKQLEDHYLNVWIAPINQKLQRASRW